jgi:hypothetical protein
MKKHRCSIYQNVLAHIPYHFGCHPKIAADPDQDPAYHFDADPDPDPAYHFDKDPDPDQACHFDADPDPQHCLLPHCRTFR